MNKFSIVPRSVRLLSIGSYVELIETNSRDQLLCGGRVLHAHLVTSGIARLTRIAAKLVTFYVECGKVLDARKVFDEMPKRDISGWVVMIGACARNGYYQESLDFFREMNKEGLKLDVFIVPSLLKASHNLLDQEFGKMIHCLVLKCSFESDAFIVSSLIDMYSKVGEVGNARKVFDDLAKQDLVVFNAMISGYANNSQADEALNLVKDMKLLGIKPDIITWNALISGFSHMGNEEKVSEILELMCLDGYKPDVVSWTSIISGLVHNFQNEKAFDAFKQMLTHGLYPNSATITTLLPACTTLANMKHGKEIHGYSIVTGLEDHGFVRSALLDYYGKCGFISEAMILFHKMRKKTTVTFNSMIFCYANHGLSDKAVELFDQMEATGEELDHLTFTAILTACSHSGLTYIGQNLFLLMQNKYRIEPRLEHYACMVDLLGRAGKLVEAYEMIKTMRMEPDLFVWGALLGACRNHGNMELARIAAKHLAELEPENSGNGLLLTSLYANAGSWESVVRMKKMIKKKRVKRFLGSSWVETV
ncbi:Pentatricopeptide repeat [Arabidopsis suecica]|uniref:Pentatricopeptide repeat n=1 Tax=Arabidopsis suecica TaxID=45249 RepID=A0A8T1Y2U2_ARASU|nr:Pentatricopeptide repeat [Arabidopsis suecica]